MNQSNELSSKQGPPPTHFWEYGMTTSNELLKKNFVFMKASHTAEHSALWKISQSSQMPTSLKIIGHSEQCKGTQKGRICEEGTYSAKLKLSQAHSEV